MRYCECAIYSQRDYISFYLDHDNDFQSSILKQEFVGSHYECSCYLVEKLRLVMVVVLFFVFVFLEVLIILTSVRTRIQ